MLVPRELIGRLLHEPLVQLSRLLKAGFALQASVKGDTDTLQRIAGDDAPEDWQTFLDYNKRDVVAERANYNRMAKMGYEDAMAIGFLAALQRTAKKMHGSAKRVEDTAIEQGLV